MKIAELVVSALTPIVVAAVGFLINRNLKQIENRQWANQKLIEKRISVFDEMAPLLNDLLCYFTYIGGGWRELSPPKVVALKRQLDKIAYTNGPLFSKQFLDKYNTFIRLCFKEYAGWGNEPKLRTHTNRRKQLAGNSWDPAWDKCFTAGLEDIPDERKVRDAYADFMSGFSRGLGIGLIVDKGDVPSGLPPRGT
jgi:hypothetical protein